MLLFIGVVTFGVIVMFVIAFGFPSYNDSSLYPDKAYVTLQPTVVETSVTTGMYCISIE